MDPSCKTPAPIFSRGSHWPETARKSLPKPPPCEDHDGESAHNCRCCTADTKAGIRPQTRIGKHWQPPSIADQAEASIDGNEEP